MCITVKEHKKYSITDQMCSMYLFIDLIKVNTSHTFPNQEATMWAKLKAKVTM